MKNLLNSGTKEIFLTNNSFPGKVHSLGQEPKKKKRTENYQFLWD